MFMQPQVTVRQDWWEVETEGGTFFLPADDFDPSEPIFGLPPIIEYEPVTGYGARLSAPGYLDCTEWTVHDTVREAVDVLNDTYGDDFCIDVDENGTPCGGTDRYCNACAFKAALAGILRDARAQGER